jgi:putative hemolysin
MAALSLVSSPETIAPVLNFAKGLRFERGRYLIRLATTKEEIDGALKLRFAVFNIELGEGLAKSFANGRDEDAFDGQCEHVILIDRFTNQIVGTCRLRNYDRISADAGFYSSLKFNLHGLGTTVLENSAEFGRACIAKFHRNKDSLKLLWRFLSEYSARNQKRYLFGCCSMNSQDPLAGGQLFDWLYRSGHVHPEFRVIPRPGSKCISYKTANATSFRVLPSSFHTYLKLGAKICGMPAIDREFRTIDFFTILDLHAIKWR